MNIRELLRYATDILKNAKIEAPVLEAGVVLCHVLKCDRTYLYSHYDRELKENELEAINHMIKQRADNVPLQYLIGETEFMSLSFVVSPAVLIPRQDTEILVEKCIELVNELSISKQKIVAGGNLVNKGNRLNTSVEADKSKVCVLDMCTGSGCIAVSIAHYCPDSRVVACDVSQDALSIARVNSERNGVQNRLELRWGDLFEALAGEQQFDIIVSNPPYIETETMPKLQKEVINYEPSLALNGGQDGLDFYREITARAPSYLAPGGYLAFEIGYNQGTSVKNLMQQCFHDIVIYKDLSGNDRVVIGQVRNSESCLLNTGLSVIPQP